jgi:hypothetical protein
VQAAQRGRLASDLRIAEAASARQARELADRERAVGTLRNKVSSAHLHLAKPDLAADFSRSRKQVTPLSCGSTKGLNA